MNEAGLVFDGRLVVDAALDPSRAFSLRLDAVLHAALDFVAVALVYELSGEPFLGRL